MKIKILFLLSLICFSLGEANPADQIFQVSTFSALSEGVYEGTYSYEELMKQGDFGLGTFNGTDGEMVALDGRFYQTNFDGKVSPVRPNQKAPFASVVFFKKSTPIEVKNLNNMKKLCAFLESHMQQKNTPHAVLISGTFHNVDLRNLHKQKPPYAPLSETVKEQHRFDVSKISGSLVGFWFPEYLNGINMERCHFHFIDENHEVGGHVLDVKIDTAHCYISPYNEFKLVLPNTKLFSEANLMGEK